MPNIVKAIVSGTASQREDRVQGMCPNFCASHICMTPEPIERPANSVKLNTHEIGTIMRSILTEGFEYTSIGSRYLRPATSERRWPGRLTHIAKMNMPPARNQK